MTFQLQRQFSRTFRLSLFSSSSIPVPLPDVSPCTPGSSVKAEQAGPAPFFLPGHHHLLYSLDEQSEGEQLINLAEVTPWMAKLRTQKS